MTFLNGYGERVTRGPKYLYFAADLGDIAQFAIAGYIQSAERTRLPGDPTPSVAQYVAAESALEWQLDLYRTAKTAYDDTPDLEYQGGLLRLDTRLLTSTDIIDSRMEIPPFVALGEMPFSCVTALLTVKQQDDISLAYTTKLEAAVRACKANGVPHHTLSL